MKLAKLKTQKVINTPQHNGLIVSFKDHTVAFSSFFNLYKIKIVRLLFVFVIALSLTVLSSTADETSGNTLIDTDFSQDPGFTTTDTNDYHLTGTYYFRSEDSEDDYVYKMIQYNGESYTLSVDFNMEECTWSGGLQLGLLSNDMFYDTGGGGMLFVGNDDGGRLFVLGFNGQSDTDYYDYSFNTWYRAILSYNAISQTATLEIRNRSTNTVVSTLEVTGVTPPSTITRWGITTIPGDQVGRAVGEIDNLSLVTVDTIITTTTSILSTTSTTSSITTTSTTIITTTTTTTTGNCPSKETYGEGSEEVELLRYIRDNVLAQTPEGRELIRLYYQWSPAVVEIMEEDEGFKEEVKDMIDGILLTIRTEIE